MPEGLYSSLWKMNPSPKMQSKPMAAFQGGINLIQFFKIDILYHLALIFMVKTVRSQVILNLNIQPNYRS